MNSIRVDCPSCQSACAIPDTLRGQRVRCPKCHEIFSAPAATPVTPAAPPLPSAEVGPRPEPTPWEGAQRNQGVRAQPSHWPQGEAPPPLSPPITRRPRYDERGPKAERSSFMPVALLVGGVLGAVLLFGGLGVVLTIWFVQALAEKQPVAQGQLQGQLPEVGGRPAPGAKLPVWKEEVQKPPVVEKIDPPIPAKNDPGPKKDPAPKQPPPVAQMDWGGGPAFDIKRCPIEQEQEERPLPGVVRDIVLGGGGRFVILSIPDTRKIAIFDVNEAKVVKYLPLAEDDALLAAGMEKLFVCLPGAKLVQRWSLRTLEREAIVPCPIEVNLKAACMGWASDGPLLLVGGDNQSLFVHPRTLQPLDLRTDKGPFQSRLGPDARASGDGTVFTCMDHHSTVRVFTIRDGVVTQRAGGTSSFISAPGLDGSLICTMIGVYTTEMVEVYPKTNQNGLIVSPFVASKQGKMFFRIGQGGHDGPKNFNFFLYGHDRPIAVMPNFVGFDSQRNTYGGEGAGRLSADRRYLLLPNAEVLVALPATNDRLLLRKFNVRELLEKSGTDYLLVTSIPPRHAVRGQSFRYDLAALAKKGPVSYKLESGPPGMQINAQGQLAWYVPQDFAAANASAILTVSDAAGQEAFHTFRVAILDMAK